MAKHILDFDCSRRRLLTGAALATGAGAGVTLGAGAAFAAPNKLSQKASGYRPTPKGKQECDNCAQWLPPAGCKLVEGEISPSGWCNIYVPKS